MGGSGGGKAREYVWIWSGGGIDGIRGKERLAVSQLDLLILQPWGEGVRA